MNGTVVLDSERVRAVFEECLFMKGENRQDLVVIEGIAWSTAFNLKRLESHRVEIESLLAELPDEFMEGAGGGMSFLNACNDRHGNQWTDFHQRMDMLFQLGGGIGRVKVLTSRKLWAIMPGGMPYYMVTKQS